MEKCRFNSAVQHIEYCEFINNEKLKMSKKTLPPLHLACSDDELQPALQHIEIVDGIATATNSHVIAQLNLKQYSKLDDDTIRLMNGKLIHRDVWEAIEDADIIEVKEDVLHVEQG